MSWYACPDCGCTDVQETAWVMANGQKVVDDEAPTDYAFCPQCDSSDLRASDFVLVEKEKPYEST